MKIHIKKYHKLVNLVFLVVAQDQTLQNFLRIGIHNRTIGRGSRLALCQSYTIAQK